MGSDYFVFYVEANVVCIVILSIMLINDRIHSMQQEKQIWFNWTIVAHILYFISDMFWAAVLSGQLPRTRILVGFFNLTNYVLLSLLAFEWFMYMAASENMPVRKSIRKRNLCRLPIIISVLALIVAYIADPLFWISESGELNGLYYPMFIFVPTLYLLASFVISMKNAAKTDSREEKRLFRLIGIYPLGVLASGLVQIFVLNAPLFCFGCTIMMMYFYIMNMQNMISVDALTRLNNRGQIDRYMDQTRFRENTRMYAMMIDIDRFKEINDTFGHAEGDRALVLTAEALKQVTECVKAQIFIGRYGGDEFTLFIQAAEGENVPEQAAEEENVPEQAAEAIRNALAVKQAENRLPYDLKVSIGYDELRDRNDTMEACLARADEKLYENKRKNR